MKNIFKKAFLGKYEAIERPKHSTLESRIFNIKSIWNNEHNDDVGIEKILRLILASIQLFVIGTYIKQLFDLYAYIYKELAVDLYILFKVFFPFFILYYNLQNNSILFFISIWFLIETITYISTLIFASDFFSRPRSYRRSMLLMFFNYLEVIMCFALIHSRGEYTNRPFEHWFDPIYFSLITSASVGYGDYYPITSTGKMIVGVQTILFFVFVVMFLNFMSSKVENKGYFNNDE